MTACDYPGCENDAKAVIRWGDSTYTYRYCAEHTEQATEDYARIVTVLRKL